METETNLVIRTNRTGYGISQCGPTMTVGELIEALEDYDPETPIYLSFDNGYTYGEINANNLFEVDAEEE